MDLSLPPAINSDTANFENPDGYQVWWPSGADGITKDDDGVSNRMPMYAHDDFEKPFVKINRTFRPVTIWAWDSISYEWVVVDDDAIYDMGGWVRTGTKYLSGLQLYVFAAEVQMPDDLAAEMSACNTITVHHETPSPREECSAKGFVFEYLRMYKS